MAYPTSPSEVGLTVAKSTLELVDELTTYSTTQTVTGKRFRKTVTITGGTVTFRDCWFYGPGFWSVRLNGGNAILEDFEIGIGPDDVTDEDPDGWQFDVHFVEVSLFAGSGWFRASSGYIHHGGDLVRIGSDCILDGCYLAHLTTDTDNHADAVQALSGSGFVIRSNYIDAQSSAELALAGATAILLKSDNGDISGTVDGNYINAEAEWAMQVRDGAGGSFPSGVVFTNNRFGRTANSGPFTTGGDGSLDVRYENRFLDDLSLIPGDSESSEGGSVGEFVQSKLEPVDSGATSTTVTFDSAPASGSLILLLFGSRSSSQIGNLVPPSGAVQLGSTQWTSGSAVTAAAWVLESAGSSAYTVTHDAPAGFGGEGGLIAVEISNPAEIAADDFDWSDVSGGETTTVTFPTSVPTASPWVAVAFAASRESFQGLTGWTNSFTEIVDYALGNGSGGVYAAYLNGTGTSSVSTVATATSAERRIHLMAVFTVSDSAQDLTGTPHDVAPTFFTGTVAPGAVNLGGALLSVGPTFATGAVGVGAVNLAGELTQIAPTFFSGVVSAGELALTGSLFQAAPTFNAGAIAATFELSGSLFQAAPSFPQGDVANLSQFLAGTLFASSPTFFTGSLGGGDRPRRRNAVVTATRRSATLS